MNLKNPFIIGGVVTFIVVFALGWNYTSALKEKK